MKQELLSDVTKVYERPFDRDWSIRNGRRSRMFDRTKNRRIAFFCIIYACNA